MTLPHVPDRCLKLPPSCVPDNQADVMHAVRVWALHIVVHHIISSHLISIPPLGSARWGQKHNLQQASAAREEILQTIRRDSRRFVCCGIIGEVSFLDVSTLSAFILLPNDITKGEGNKCQWGLEAAGIVLRAQCIPRVCSGRYWELANGARPTWQNVRIPAWETLESRVVEDSGSASLSHIKRNK